MISPSHRLEVVQALVDNGSPPPADAVMTQLYFALRNMPAAEEVKYALDIFEEQEHRAMLDAFLLTKAPAELIGRVLQIPQNVIETYAYLFLDVAALRNRLELLSFAASYEGDRHAKELVKTAVTVGVEYLLWMHGVAAELEPRTVVRRTMTDGFYRGLAHRGNSLTSQTAKEALRWWSVAVRNAELLEKLDPKASTDALGALRIALEGNDETVPLEKSPVSADQILH